MSDQKISPSGGKKGPRFSFNLYWIYIAIFAVFVGLQFFNFTGGPQDISMKDLLRSVSQGDVAAIEVVNETYALVTIKPEALEKAEYKSVQKKFTGASNLGPHFRIDTGPADKFEEKIMEAQAHLPKEEQIQVNYVIRRNIWEGLLGWLIPIGLMVLVWVFLMRRMSGGAGGAQIFNIGKSRAKLFDKDSKVNVTFSDVAGLDEAKVELMEIVEFLKNPKKYTTLGGKIPKGALLIGPPGTGKTLLAKAIAGEAGVPFFSLSGSDFVEMFVGVGASRVRDLFKQAKEKAPCIIFIDEIDAIGRARGRSVIQGANDERENTLNQLLTEMDGFESNSGVIIIAATNRVDILDKALIRPGRFDRQISIDLPDLNGRKEIFKVHTKGLKIAKNIDLDLLARQTPGFSGADIANVCNEAALIAARKGKNEIQKEDFNDAIDRVIGGLEKKNKIISPEEKRVVAYHEAGHAVVSWLLRYASPLVKVTIVPRGQSLGAAWYLPEERQITTTEQILDELTATMGGRAAEQVIFGKISTGALSDLERVTKQAYAMVSLFGLNERLGNLSYYDSTGQSEYALTKPYSEKTAEIIDEEVKKIVENAYQRAVNILKEYREKLIAVAERLIEKEVIYREDMEEILGPRPFETTVHHGAVAESNGKPEDTEPLKPLPEPAISGTTPPPTSADSNPAQDLRS
ncbi:MAG: ATP-dependent zinc metalloprotease FtsH [Flavobacteriales bacterium]|nr:ATP-dependent zinc metalloprotease FtsH [Flavobacteriales bacterium]MCX7650032.1 ATP-dependent zinc metalloprotease FtsH [Flavobacteriales bacterium]MDW8432356.1 ATP-dependent zinc metalloprotease FtsH [Flavobacteriales bacterium]